MIDRSQYLYVLWLDHVHLIQVAFILDLACYPSLFLYMIGRVSFRLCLKSHASTNMPSVYIIGCAFISAPRISSGRYNKV